MYHLWNSCVSPKWTFVGFLWRLGESLRVVSRELGYIEKVSERAKGFPNHQGDDSLFCGQTLARAAGEEAR